MTQGWILFMQKAVSYKHMEHRRLISKIYASYSSISQATIGETDDAQQPHVKPPYSPSNHRVPLEALTSIKGKPLDPISSQTAILMRCGINWPMDQTYLNSAGVACCIYLASGVRSGHFLQVLFRHIFKIYHLYHQGLAI